MIILLSHSYARVAAMQPIARLSSHEGIEPETPVGSYIVLSGMNDSRESLLHCTIEIRSFIGIVRSC